MNTLEVLKSARGFLAAGYVRGTRQLEAEEFLLRLKIGLTAAEEIPA